MERKGEAAGVRVYDSYAHHPVEIAGDLQAGRAVAGDGRLVVAFQPHLVSRTRIFGPAMGEALGAADEVVVLDVYLAREDADPDVTGRLVADAVPLPADRVAFVPELADAAGRAGRAGAARRPGADPRRRQRHRGRARRCWSCSPSGRRPMRSGTRTDDTGQRHAAGRRGDGAHPQAVRAPAVGAPLAGLAVRRRCCCWRSRWSSAAVWLVFFSSVLAVNGVEVRGDQHPVGRARSAQVAAVPEGEPLARVDLDAIRARVEALAVVRSADVTRQWPDEVLIEIEERVAIAVVDIGGQRARDGRGRRRVPGVPPGARRACRASRPRPGTRTDALREAAAVVSALPEDLASRVDHVEVETIDRISLVLRDGRTVMWGSADESEQKAEVLAELLRQNARAYDVSVPGRPTTSD